MVLVADCESGLVVRAVERKLLAAGRKGPGTMACETAKEGEGLQVDRLNTFFVSKSLYVVELVVSVVILLVYSKRRTE